MIPVVESVVNVGSAVVLESVTVFVVVSVAVFVVVSVAIIIVDFANNVVVVFLILAARASRQCFTQTRIQCTQWTVSYSLDTCSLPVLVNKFYCLASCLHV